MIKGVNRQVVEVNETESEYFEKIMFFVKPEYAGISEGKIREKAGLIAGVSETPPKTKYRKSRYTEFVKLALSALAGALLTLIVVISVRK